MNDKADPNLSSNSSSLMPVSSTRSSSNLASSAASITPSSSPTVSNTDMVQCVLKYIEENELPALQYSLGSIVAPDSPHHTASQDNMARCFAKFFAAFESTLSRSATLPASHPQLTYKLLQHEVLLDGVARLSERDSNTGGSDAFSRLGALHAQDSIRSFSIFNSLAAILNRGFHYTMERYHDRLPSFPPPSNKGKKWKTRGLVNLKIFGVSFANHHLCSTHPSLALILGQLVIASLTSELIHNADVNKALPPSHQGADRYQVTHLQKLMLKERLLAKFYDSHDAFLSLTDFPDYQPIPPLPKNYTDAMKSDRRAKKLRMHAIKDEHRNRLFQLSHQAPVQTAIGYGVLQGKFLEIRHLWPRVTGLNSLVMDSSIARQKITPAEFLTAWTKKLVELADRVPNAPNATNVDMELDDAPDDMDAIFDVDDEEYIEELLDEVEEDFLSRKEQDEFVEMLRKRVEKKKTHEESLISRQSLPGDDSEISLSSELSRLTFSSSTSSCLSDSAVGDDSWSSHFSQSFEKEPSLEPAEDDMMELDEEFDESLASKVGEAAEGAGQSSQQYSNTLEERFHQA